MTGTLADHLALNRCSTHKAGFTCALVDTEVILEISSAIDPVKAGAVSSDAFFEDTAHSVQQLCALFESDLVCGGQGMDSGYVQRLVGIDIPNASQERLVEQQRFDLPARALQHIAKRTRIQIGIKWLWSQPF